MVKSPNTIDRKMNIINKEMRGKSIDFERIRRITGYLVPDIRYWNNGKKSELRDRVKHNVERILYQ